VVVAACHQSSGKGVAGLLQIIEVTSGGPVEPS
jgi:hypothetical protein